MKNRTLLGLLLCFLLGGFIVAQISQEKAFASQEGTVIVSSGSTLNMRKGIGTKYDVILEIPSGAQVVILDTEAGKDSNGTAWYKVSYGANEGFVSSTYIAIKQEGTTETTAPQESVAPVTSSTPVTTVYYRTQTTYKAISVKAKMKAKTQIYQNTSKKALVKNRKKVLLAAKKSVTIIGETTKGSTKWFQIQFTWKGKKQQGYVKSTSIQLANKTGAYAVVDRVKSVLSMRKKAGNSNPYYRVNGQNLTVDKGGAVQVLKSQYVSGKLWYQISFKKNERTYKAYVYSKYVKFAKKPVKKKVPVTVLSTEEFEAELTKQGFPESYKPYLRSLHAAYPYWQFQANRTGLDWATAVEKESEVGLNLISNAKSEAWKSKEKGAYNESTGKWKVFDGSSWVAASKAAVAYYMDPRNFITIQGIFQFELLEYQSEYQTVDGIKKIFANTPFADASFTYEDDETGTEKTITYAAAFRDAAKKSGVSPYHLASRCKQEVVTGATTTSIAVTGTNGTYPGIYNFYNIGASNGSNAAQRGLGWASSGTDYLRPWNNRYRSIVGGAMYIGQSYINKGQNTGYLEKFNVTPNNTYEHQYMANVEAANSEAIKVKNGYNGMLDAVPIIFSIPVYENMPEEKCPVPQ